MSRILSGTWRKPSWSRLPSQVMPSKGSGCLMVGRSFGRLRTWRDQDDAGFGQVKDVAAAGDVFDGQLVATERECQGFKMADVPGDLGRFDDDFAVDYGVVELVPGDDLVGMAGQAVEQTVLGGGQGYPGGRPEELLPPLGIKYEDGGLVS